MFTLLVCHCSNWTIWGVHVQGRINVTRLVKYESFGLCGESDPSGTSTGLRAKSDSVGVEVVVHGRGICNHALGRSPAAVIGVEAASSEL